MASNPHTGSGFDEFLEEEGLLADAEAVALKRVIAFELAQEMEAAHVSKSTLAKRMKTSRVAVNRLLDPESKSLTLGTVARAATALGKRLKISFVNPPAARRVAAKTVKVTAPKRVVAKAKTAAKSTPKRKTSARVAAG